MKTSKKIILLVALVLLILPSVTYAVSWLPLVPCGTSANPTPCNQCDLLKLLKNIIDFVLMGLMPPAAAILFVWGGFLILMGGANPGMISQGKSIFWNTAIGVAIVSASWMITNTIVRSIGVETITQNGVVTNVASEWWKFECRVTTGGPPPPLEKKYACQNNQCIESATGAFTEPTCNNSCAVVPPAQKYSCNSSNQCVADISGTYTTNDCDNKCQAPPVGALSISTTSLSDARQDFDYFQTVQATGGTTPYHWSISGSSQLPAGLLINSSNGEIKGKPTTAGNFSFTVEVQDSSSPIKSSTKQLSLRVVAPAASVVISNVRTGIIDSVSATIGWSTDKPSTSQVESGRTTSYDATTTLDSAMVLNHSVALTNLISNTVYNYRVISTIPGYTARSSNYTFMTLDSSVLSISPTSLPNGIQNTAYSVTLIATGGQAPYRWAVLSGSLPAGLTLNQLTGVISGTPTTAVAAEFFITLRDASPIKSLTQKFSIVVGGAGSTLACMFNGVNYSTLNLCSRQSRPGGCGTSLCAQYLPAVQQYANGAATVQVLKTFMVIESDCNTNAGTGTSYGLMQLTPQSVAPFANRCGISPTSISPSWLKANPNLSICLAAAYINGVSAGKCGSNPAHIYAGYNGDAAKACAPSADCTGSSCSGGPVEAWECPYDDVQHTSCNTGYYQTKQGATYVNYCLNNLGF